MAHNLSHSGHEHHDHQPPQKRRIHHDWRFWAVIAMLVGMVIYVVSMNEALRPWGKPRQEVPAAP